MFQVDKSQLILVAMLAGIVSLFLGYRLLVLGINGSASISGEVKSIKLSLRNASPGIFFALFGAILLVSGIWKQDLSVTKTSADGVRETYISKGDVPSGTYDDDRAVALVAAAHDARVRHDLEGAKAIYEVASAWDRSGVALNNLADALLEQGRASEALVPLARAEQLMRRDLSANLPVLLKTKAAAQAALGKQRDALATVDEGLKMRPGDAALAKLRQALIPVP